MRTDKINNVEYIDYINKIINKINWFGKSQLRQDDIPMLEKIIDVLKTDSVNSAHWIIDKDYRDEDHNDSWYKITCSNCGEYVVVNEKALPYEHFCSNCGSFMKDGELNNE